MSVTRRTGPLRVTVLAFEGCMSAAVAAVLDVIHIANGWARGRDASVSDVLSVNVAAAAEGSVRGSSGFSFPAIALSQLSADVVIVPPCAGAIASTLAANPALIAWLRGPHGAVVASVCTGVFFLAEAGLLRGRRATTNPAYAATFRRRYPDVELTPELRVTDAGQVLCAGSTSASLDLILYVIERFVGHELAVLTAKSMCMDMAHRSQQPYFQYVAPKDHGDDTVLGLQTWLESNFDQQVSVAQLARRGALSERSLNRRFRGATGLSPLEYVHRLRIAAAKRLLESSSLSVDEITARVGYADARSFSRLFRTLGGVSPREYRRRFGPLILQSHQAAR